MRMLVFEEMRFFGAAGRACWPGSRETVQGEEEVDVTVQLEVMCKVSRGTSGLEEVGQIWRCRFKPTLLLNF
jgi:hypothetical protein